MPAKRKVSKRKVTRKTVKKVKKTKKVKKVKASKVKKLAKIRKPYTKSELYTALAERLELSKKQIGSFFEHLEAIIAAHLSKGAAGEFKIPGLLKMAVRIKKATPARKGVNPFTGEVMMFKKKPAMRKVKVTALKNLKDMAA